MRDLYDSESEGSYLSNYLDEMMPDDERQSVTDAMAGERRTKLYELAKAAKTGTECTCPSCAKKFTKKSYQQAFCSNKGSNNCKDAYWNRANDQRLQRAAYFAR